MENIDITMISGQFAGIEVFDSDQIPAPTLKFLHNCAALVKKSMNKSDQSPFCEEAIKVIWNVCDQASTSSATGYHNIAFTSQINTSPNVSFRYGRALSHCLTVSLPNCLIILFPNFSIFAPDAIYHSLFTIYMSDNIIEAINISKSYAKKEALKNINLTVPRGSVYGLLGPNGAGKTTFIRILTQIIGPDSGEILLNGKQIQRSDIEHIGYMPEERGLYKKMKVGEQVEYFSRLKGLTKEQTFDAIKYWFNVFDIKDWYNKKMEELSKGMQQKVQFIVTVIHKPSLIILDEPFSGFDPLNAELIRDQILKLRDEGATIILSTHRMESVEALCDYISLINNSQKVIEGRVHDIQRQFKENLFELNITATQGNMPDLSTWGYDLHQTIPQSDGTTTIRFMAKKDTPSNDILQHFMPIGQVHSFKEVLPSINDVFIKLVKGESK